MIWFTADLHLGHANIIKYCFRPFNNVDEMNEKIIQNWNSVVKDSDTVYVLGDFILSNNEKEVVKLLGSLNGAIVLIIGDHDESSRKFYHDRFSGIHSFFKLMRPRSYNVPDISLFHYCMKVWPKSHYNSWHLFGHSHGRLKAEGKSHDVGVDCNNFTPISLDQIIEIMKLKEDNFNLIKSGKSEEDPKLEQLEISFKW